MSPNITENTIEELTIKLLAHNGYQYIYAPEIAHDGGKPERTSALIGAVGPGTTVNSISFLISSLIR